MTQPLFAEPRTVRDASECYFYHSMEIPGYGEVRGEWDLRARTPEYLGNVDFAGKRVLEIGPASGYLTFHMERQGAEVVCVDVDDSRPWDFVPQAGLIDARFIEDRRQHIARMKNGFWLAHRAFGSKARVHYGDPAARPAALGRFDIAVMANVLLHCRDAAGIVAECASVVDRTPIVTDWKVIESDLPVAYLVPTAENRFADTWWAFSPPFFEQLFCVLGMPRVRSAPHEQLHASGEMRPMYTVVGER